MKVEIPGEMGPRLKGKVAIVAGAGSVAVGVGNGRAAALLLARHGAKVALLDANEKSAQETQEMIAADGGESFAMKCDVTVEEDCRHAVQATVDKYGRLDILMNNVGMSKIPGDATTVNLDSWERGMRINVTSMVLMTRYAVPEMKKSGGGSIINISSITGITGGMANLFYPTSKGAILNMTRTMAGNHGPDGIRVNCICPGFLYTPVVSSNMPAGFREARRDAGALKVEGDAWDVAFGTLFLASDESRWITGVILPIDAGVTAISPHFNNASPSTRIKAENNEWEKEIIGSGSKSKMD
jgi:NAD(P)-dependent dehydrogenase (short-subunit alcohol dehydrogenase family)